MVRRRQQEKGNLKSEMKLYEWLKQQSTQKAIAAFIVAVAAFAAPQFGITEEMINQLFATFLLIYSGLAGFRDKS